MAEEKKKIFIVDDDEAVLTSLKRLLVLSGFDVEVTFKSQEALAKIKNFKPHIIIMDLLMPHLGGLEVCEMLNNDKETSDIPILIISALGREEDVKKAYRLGVVGYFTKPYDFAQVLKEITKAIVYKSGEVS